MVVGTPRRGVRRWFPIDLYGYNADILCMKTTLDIPESIMASALSASPVKTKRAVVVRALEEYIQRAEMAALAEELGHSRTFMSPEDLSALRDKEKDSLFP